jgi:hypothetical protein
MRYLGPDGTIDIGESGKDKLLISSHPCCWEIPLSINEDVLISKSLPANLCIDTVDEIEEEE